MNSSINGLRPTLIIIDDLIHSQGDTMNKYTFEIYETWKIEESFEAETLEDAWDLATNHANSFELDTNTATFVNNEVEIIGEP